MMPPRHAGPRRGFSLIEVLLVLVLTVFGFIGILTLQLRSTQAVSDAKDLMLATTLAGHFLETVKIEALQWQNATSLGLTQAHFRLLANADGQWQPAYTTAGGGTALVGRLGNANDASGSSPEPISDLDQGVLREFAGQVPKFCVFYRLTPIVPDTVLRVEARVLFRRADGVWNPAYGVCDPARLTDMVRDQANVATVSALTTVGQNLVGL